MFAGAAAIVFGQKGATSDTEQVTLILKHTNKNRLGAIGWGPNDFDVLAEGRCIGRIFTSRQFWTITAREYPLTNP